MGRPIGKVPFIRRSCQLDAVTASEIRQLAGYWQASEAEMLRRMVNIGLEHYRRLTSDAGLQHNTPVLPVPAR